jgi:carboxymethylenebutenolidase
MNRGSLSLTMVALAGVLAGGIGMYAFGSRAIAADAHNHGASPRLDVTTHGEWIKYVNPKGDSIRAYVAYPERKEKAPGIIVITEVFGMTEWEPTVADRLAGAGYVAIVPDLLSSRFGVSPATTDSGRKLTALLVPAEVTADLDATYGYLNGLPAVNKDQIGTIGFCWGGAQSFRYATTNPKLKAAVVCYGNAPDSAAIRQIKAKVLGVYGEDDARINAALPDVDRQAKAAGVDYTYAIYGGTGHGFLKPGRKGNDTPAVATAWEKIIGFYKETLK